MPTSTPQRIVDMTRTLMQRKGYHGTGLARIAEAAGAPKGSLYFHFPGGKEQLTCAAVAASGESGAQVIERTVADAPSLLGALESLYDGFARQLDATGYAEGCPIATIAAEMAPYSDAIAGATRAAFDRWMAPVARRMVAEGADEAAARRAAVVVLSMLEGAIIVAKAQRSSAPIEACRRSLPAILTTGGGAG